MNSYTADKYDNLMKKRTGSKNNYFRIGRDVRMVIISFGSLVNQVLVKRIAILYSITMENK